MIDRPTSPLDVRRAIADDRARAIAASWRRGDRTIRTLAARYSVSRDTVYADLRAQGIDPTDRTAPIEEETTAMRACPLCEENLDGDSDELFDHISDHGHHEVVAWVVDQAI